MAIDALNELGTSLLEEVKKGAGDVWGKWAADDRALVTRCAQRAAALTALHVAGRGDLAAGDVAQINAQLDGIRDALKYDVKSALWRGATNLILKAGGSLLRSAGVK